MDAETQDRDLVAECTEIGDLLMQSSMPILAANFNCLAQEIATALEAGDLAQARQAVDAAWQKAADEIRSVVTDNAPRVAELGGWPNYIPPESLAERVPINGETAAGFDAAIACARDHIPRDKQRLAAKLHAAYSQEAIQQVRDEALFLTPDSQTTYWLAIKSNIR